MEEIRYMDKINKNQIKLPDDEIYNLIDKVEDMIIESYNNNVDKRDRLLEQFDELLNELN